MMTAKQDVGPVREIEVRPAAGGPILIGTEPAECATSEQYRILRTRLLHKSPGTRMLLISSAAQGDGKTVTAINLAATLGWRDMKVLLMDADLRRSGITSALKIDISPGIGEILVGRSTIAESVVRVRQNPNLYILPAGYKTGNPAEQLDSQNWWNLCAAVREEFDYVVVDAPPCEALADYELLQDVSDSVVLVVRPDQTPRPALNRVLTLIPPDKLIGIVVNAAAPWPLQQSHRAYSYYSGLGKGGQ